MAKKRKKRTQRLPSTSAAGRTQCSKETFDQLKQDLEAMPPETLLHVGDQLVMTDEMLQAELREYTSMIRAMGLEGEGAEDKDIYNTFRAINGLDQVMTAAEMLAKIETRSQQWA